MRQKRKREGQAEIDREIESERRKRREINRRERERESGREISVVNFHKMSENSMITADLANFFRTQKNVLRNVTLL